MIPWYKHTGAEPILAKDTWSGINWRQAGSVSWFLGSWELGRGGSGCCEQDPRKMLCQSV